MLTLLLLSFNVTKKGGWKDNGSNPHHCLIFGNCMSFLGGTYVCQQYAIKVCVEPKKRRVNAIGASLMFLFFTQALTF